MMPAAPLPGDQPPHPRALRLLQREHPSYEISWGRREPGHLVRYVAVARRAGIHPWCVVSGSLAELDAALDPGDGQRAGLAQLYALRPGDPMST
jgi:hypothetical protein